MRLQINRDKPINELRKEFGQAYPFLQIEFFNNGNVRRDRYPAVRKIDHNKTLGDACSLKTQKAFIEIDDATTVFQLESILMDDFGLSAQVFRKSGNVWLETTMTDDWTLKQQNDHGREISIGSDDENKEYKDFDLNRDS